MWDRILLKKNGKEAFIRNYWSCVGICVLVLLLSGTLFRFIYSYSNTGSDAIVTESYATYDPEMLVEEMNRMVAEIVAFCMKYWLEILLFLLVAYLIAFGIQVVFYNVLSVGLNRYFLENREHKTSIGKLFYNFHGGRFGSTVWVMFLRTLYIFGWSLLFLIPGIIKSYSYMLVPYIMAENPSMDSGRVFQLSQEMMRGYKWEAFKLELSFFGWYLLASYAPLLNIFYLNPYVYATYAEFYSALKAEARNNGILQPGELSTKLVVEEEVNA